MFRRSNQTAVLSPLLVLCMSAPALAQPNRFRTYEGFATHIVDGVVHFNRVGTIHVDAGSGSGADFRITFTKFSGSRAAKVTHIFSVTVSGTSYSGTGVFVRFFNGFEFEDQPMTISGEICETISGEAVSTEGPLQTLSFVGECVRGCESLLGLTPECGGEQEEEEEEEEICATERRWINVDGGSLNDAENWQDGAVPGPQHVAVFDIRAVTVDVTSNVTHDSLDISGNVNLNLNGFTYTLDPCAERAVRIKSFLCNIARNGVLVARGNVFVEGDQDGAANLLLLSGAQFNVEDGQLSVGLPSALLSLSEAELRTSGTTFIHDNGTIALSRGAIWTALDQCQIGVAGSGLLDIRDGGKFSTGENVNVFVGGLLHTADAPSDGRVILTGSGTLWEQPTGGNLTVGEALGFGSFIVENGAKASVSNGKTDIARQEDSNGRVTVTDTGTQWVSSFLNVGVGRSSTGVFELLEGAAASIGEVTIAVNPRSVGRLEVKGANTQMSVFDKIQVGDSGSAELHISDGGAVFAPQASVSRTLLGKGLVTVTGLNSKWTVANTLTVGEGGAGEVQVTQGGRLSVDGELIIGDQGIGTLKVDSSGLVNSSSAVIARSFITSRGTVNVGANGTWINTGLLAVGDILFGGTAVLNIDSTGSVITDTLIIGPEGQVNGKVVTVSGVAQALLGLFVNSNAKPVFSQKAATPFKGLLRAQAASEPLPGLTTRRLIIEEGGELIADTITLGPGGEIGGSGAANLDIISKGTIDPGGEEDETAEFTINGDLTLEADSEVQVDIGGLIPGEEYDVLIVNGHCQLGGRLKINLVNGYLPNVGDRFEVLKYESREGEYDTIDSDGTGVYFMPELANGRLTLIAAVVDESGRLSPEELADLALMQGACAPGCGPMGLMPLSLTLLGICGIRAGVARRPRAKNAQRPLR